MPKGLIDSFALSEDEEKALHDEGTPRANTGQSDTGEDEFSDLNGDDAERKSQPRDPAGRFAPKQEAEPEPEPQKQEAEEEGEEQDDEFKSFLDKHKDKKPEELLRLAYQQNKARAERSTEAKRHREEAEAHARALQQIMDRIAQARQAKAQEIDQRRQQFDEQLKHDPDAATRKLHDEMLAREARELEQRQWNEFVENQRRIFDESIRRETGKGMNDIAQDLFRYAVEEGGYTPDEVARASDARDLITLDRARRFQQLVRQGVILPTGEINPNYRAPAQQPQTPQARGAAALDRAAAVAQQAPRTLSDARGANPDARKSLRARAEEILSLDGREFGKLAESGELDQILRDLDRA
jgi:hypothetical protein